MCCWGVTFVRPSDLSASLFTVLKLWLKSELESWAPTATVHDTSPAQQGAHACYQLPSPNYCHVTIIFALSNIAYAVDHWTKANNQVYRKHFNGRYFGITVDLKIEKLTLWDFWGSKHVRDSTPAAKSSLFFTFLNVESGNICRAVWGWIRNHHYAEKIPNPLNFVYCEFIT